MPIKVQRDLPAREILENENIFVMDEYRSLHQDIRPLKIVILNLMPLKEDTELQILRSLSNSPLQVDITFLTVESHVSKNTSANHLNQFYTTFGEIKPHRYDGMIITGAPVEQIPFEQVDYWEDLCRIMDYAKKKVFCTLYICWGAQAGLYHLYGVQKHLLEKKLFGVFPHSRTTNADPLLRGFDDIFPIPHSRHTGINIEDILAEKSLTILAQSPLSGPSIIKSSDNRSVFIMGHLEYDANTLADEYWRDKNKGLAIDIPQNYFPGDNPVQIPSSTWRSTAHLFYSNWLNYYVYQETPYNFCSW